MKMNNKDRITFYNNIDAFHHLSHAVQGGTWENTSYYQKVVLPNGKPRYFYSKEEYDAYMNHQHGGVEEEGSNRNGNKSPEQIANENKKQKEALEKNQQAQQRTTTTSYSPKKQKIKLDRAKTSRKFDKQFLMVAQFMGDIDDEKRLKEYKKYLENPDEYCNKYITKELKSLGKGGKVNLNLRPEIPSEYLNEVEWDAGDGYATIFSSTYANEANDTFYNFTPIIVDPKTGEYIDVMPPEEFEEYCYAVIDGLRKDDYALQIGGGFSGENALQNAIDAADKIHKLHETKHNLNNKA